MSLQLRVLEKIRDLRGLPPYAPVNLVAALEWLDFIGKRILQMWNTQETMKGGYAMLTALGRVGAECEPEPVNFVDVIGGIAWDFGAAGLTAKDLEPIAQKMPETKKVVEVKKGLVSLH